jgi:hypothetical protein
MVDKLFLPPDLARDRVADSDLPSLLAVAGGIDVAVSEWLARKPAPDRLFVTLASADFEPGLKVMVRSLRAVSGVPILVLQIGSWNFEHEAADVAVLRVPRLVRPGFKARPLLPHLETTMSKLWTFSLTTPRRVAFIDADCLVIRTIDDLFEGEGFAAAPDLFLHYQVRAFNSGVFGFSPSAAIRSALFSSLPKLSMADGDQSVLNTFFRDWRQLPLSFNFLRNYALVRALAEDRSLRVIHYTTGKPWMIGPTSPRDYALAPLEERWFAALSDEEFRAVKRDWQANLDAVERNLLAWSAGFAGAYRDQVATAVRSARRSLARWLAALAVFAALQTLLLVWLLLRS